jgi:YVTN family beta-propeller protein
MGIRARAVAARPRTWVATGLAVLLLATAAAVAAAVTLAGGSAAPPSAGFAYIATGFSVVPLNLSTGVAGKPIPQPGEALGIAAAPDGRTVYVTNGMAGTVTPISTVTNKPGRPIPAGSSPDAIVIPPGGTTAYVGGTAAVTPINLATGTPGKPIPLPGEAGTIAVAPDGRTIYVTSEGGTSPTGTEISAITPISTITNRAGTPIVVGDEVGQLAFALDGRIMYAVMGGTPTSVTPIDTRTGKTQTPVGDISAVAVSADGDVAYFSDTSNDTITPVNPVSGSSDGNPVPLGVMPGSMIIEPDGTTAWVLAISTRNYVRPPGTPIFPPEEIIPVNLTTGSTGRPFAMPQGCTGMTATPDPDVLMLWCQKSFMIRNMSTGRVRNIDITGTFGIHIVYVAHG